MDVRVFTWINQSIDLPFIKKKTKKKLPEIILKVENTFYLLISIATPRFCGGVEDVPVVISVSSSVNSLMFERS